MTAIARDVAEPGDGIELRVWRHPKPFEASGRCIGRTDLRVDRRRIARLAARIATAARRESLPREVWTSPLARCADVGRVLARRMGFVHRMDARLAELDFGAWDGRRWSEIAPVEVALWEADFAHGAPGGGESLASLVRRTREFIGECAARYEGRAATVLVVAHAGWISAARLAHASLPGPAQWPAPIAYGASVRVRCDPQEQVPIAAPR